MANKAIKFRAYPTTEQEILINKTFGCCRKVYNLMLSDKIESYKNTGKFAKVTPAMYKKKFPYLKEVDSLALSNKQLDLQRAFNNCFSKSRKKKSGFPKFKSLKRSRKSYTTNNQKGTVAIVNDNSIRLPKLGMIKAVIHRSPDNDRVIKSATVSQDSDGSYYISILFEYENTNNKKIANIQNVIGLDYASNGLYVDNNGNRGSNHKFYSKSHKKLSKAQRQLSRKQGNKKNSIKSKNYLKQLHKVNKIQRHIANQRKDNLHKISNKIANCYDVVCVESLDMKAMSNKSFGNGKSTLDNGYGMFINMLEYKLSDRGKYLIKVDKRYASSQRCNVCGKIHPHMKDLSRRVMICECGNNIDRDQNAAINILNEGLRLLNKEMLSA